MPSLVELSDDARLPLLAAASSGRYPQSLLLAGSAARAETVALAVAAARNCHRLDVGCHDDEHACASCKKLILGVHPDYTVLRGDGPSEQISIEAVREQIIVRLGLSAHEANVRVFVLMGADTLGGPAANALLKSLEEPPRDTMFVLVAQALAAVLPTLRSRCQIIRLQDDARSELRDDELELAAKLARDPITRELANHIVAQKGRVATILEGAIELQRNALRHAAATDLTRARTISSRMQRMLRIARSVEMHNMNPGLAMDELTAREAQ